MPAKKPSPDKKLAVLVTLIERRIYLIRGLKVMIDSDLAELYGVETKILNRGVRRNLERFPEDFMFQLTREEYTSLRFQIGILKVPHFTRPRRLRSASVQRACNSIMDLRVFGSKVSPGR